MKNILLITLCSLLYCNIIVGQCPPLEVSTDPQNPFNKEVGNVQSSPYFNNFNWQTPYYYPGNYVLLDVQSPFESTTNINFFNKLSTDTDIKDYYVEDGWELLNENITSTNQTDVIYFTLYNKYSSIIRVLFAMEESSAAAFTTVSVKLRFDDDNINAILHPSGAIAQPLDRESEKTVFVSVPMATNDFHFMIADFPVEYDPCVCFKANLAKLKTTFSLVLQQTIDLKGTLLSMNTNIATIADGTKDNLDVGQFLLSGTLKDGNITAGTLIFESIDELILEYEKLKSSSASYNKKLANLAKAKQALSLIAAAATVTAVIVGTGGGAVPVIAAGATAEAIQAAKALSTASAAANKATVTAFKATADIAKGLSPFSDFFSYKVSAEKSAATGAANSAINKIGSVGVNFGALTINGTLNTNQPQSTGILMAIPGGASTTPIINSNFYPKYDNVLGRIAVLKTPEVKIGREQSISNSGHLQVYRTRYTDRISFDAFTFDYVFNPAAGVSEEETVIFAGLEIIAIKSGAPSLLKDEFYNVNFADVEETAERIIFNSEFVPLSCLSDLNMQLKFLSREERDRFPYFTNFGDYTIVAVNIKLVISYAFNQIGRSGTKNRAVQIVTYPTKIITTPFAQIPAPISNNGTPIPTELELSTNQNFTTNTTIFAWEKIIIDADLTAAAGVNVEIIAPEIIVKNGNIGSGIRLMQGFYPNDCTQLNPVSRTKVENFCKSNNYKANQSKHTQLVDDVPKLDKPYTPVAFQTTPNPFTNTFNIEFELENESTTSLMVFDALGRVVETVIANDNLVGGKHQYQIDGSGLESGIYYVRLQTDDNVQTIKIMKQ
jgi:hypothetical protein